MQSYNISFKGQNIYVGIDVHLRTWTITVLAETGYKKTFTQPADSKALFEHLKKNYPEGIYHAVYESGFADTLVVTNCVTMVLIASLLMQQMFQHLRKNVCLRLILLTLSN